MRLLDGQGQEVPLGPQLGRGGEATVYSLQREPKSVAKLYHSHSTERVDKLKAMVDHPPRDSARQQGHVSICWPERLLFNEHRQCVGFVMPKLDHTTYGEMLRFYNPQDRREHAPSFTWEYLVRAALNVCIVVEAVHARGYVIGDVNESNFFISTQALVTLVDCDSMQVRTPQRTFRCTVGKPEYLPPELHGADLSTVDRTPAQDNFSLAILLFLLLMEGVHPYSGTWNGPGDPPPVEERIRLGECPYTGGRHVLPMPAAPPFDLLPPELRALFVHAFGAGHAQPSARPAAREWEHALRAVTLAQCKVSAQHRYSKHLRACPWCARKSVLNGFDPYPDPASLASGAAPKQQPLPARPFRASAVPSQTPLSARTPVAWRFPAIQSWSASALAWGTPLLAAMASLLLYAGLSYGQQSLYFWSVWLTSALTGLLYGRRAARSVLRRLCTVIAFATAYALLGGASLLPVSVPHIPLLVAAGTYFGFRFLLRARRANLQAAAYRGSLLRAVLVPSLLLLVVPPLLAAMVSTVRTRGLPNVLSARFTTTAPGLPTDIHLQVCAHVTPICACQPRAVFHRGDAFAVMLTSMERPALYLTATWPNSFTQSIALPASWTTQAGTSCKVARLQVPRSVEPGAVLLRASTGVIGAQPLEANFTVTR